VRGLPSRRQGKSRKRLPTIPLAAVSRGIALSADERQIERLLTMRECIELLEDVYVELSEGLPSMCAPR
jgi:hypothetical protein